MDGKYTVCYSWKLEMETNLDVDFQYFFQTFILFLVSLEYNANSLCRSASG